MGGMFSNLHKRRMKPFDRHARILFSITLLGSAAVFFFIEPLNKKQKEDIAELQVIAQRLEEVNNELRTAINELLETTVEKD